MELNLFKNLYNSNIFCIFVKEFKNNINMWYDVEYKQSFASILGVDSIDSFNKEHETNLDFGDFVPTVSTVVELPDYVEPNDINICYYLGLKEVPYGLKYGVSRYQE